MSRHTLPPAPPGEFLLGHLRMFTRDSIRFMLMLREVGDLTTLWFGPFPVYSVNSAALAHEVFVGEAANYYKSVSTKTVLGPILGNGLFLSDGAFWKRQRKLVQPAFHSKRIGAYADVMVNYALELADDWQRAAGDGAAREVDLDMTHLTMAIIARTLFDADVTGEAREVAQVIVEALELVDQRFNSLLLAPEWLPTPANRKMKQVVGRLDALIQKFIVERRASGVDKGDLLSMLMLAQDDDASFMTDQQVRDEAMTLFGAGHETTAVTMTWIWYALSQYPDVEAKLHAELDRVLGGRAPTLADLANLPYTEQVVKEALRLYPPAWGTTRDVAQPTALGGFPLRPGEVLMLNIYGIHTDARNFPDPLRFDPERFAPENEKRIPKHAYLPFGAGPRVCIGNMFAMVEARLLLATLAQRFRLSYTGAGEAVPERRFTLKPRGGMRMRVHARVPEMA